MLRTIEGRHLGLGTLHDAPPHWAVVTVKCCLVGILALPVTTFLWLGVSYYWPSQAAALAPLAFALTIALGLAMIVCASVLTSMYPPVPPTAKR